MGTNGLWAAIRELMQDEVPRTSIEIISHCRHLIPPEVAARRLQSRHYHVQGSLNQRIESGTRVVIQSALSGMVRCDMLIKCGTNEDGLLIYKHGRNRNEKETR